MLDSLTDLLVRYYLTPGYNIVNTVTYGLVLGLIVFKLIPRLKPLLGRIDLRFMLMLTPFILYGATVRELVDQSLGVYGGHTEFPGNYFLVAPGIYVTMFALTFSIIVAALGARRMWGGDYRLYAGAAGSMLFLYNLTLIIPNITNPGIFTTVCVFFTISAVFLYALRKLAPLGFLGFEGNFIIALVHLFDASTTFVGVDLIGHSEKHVVPTFFINLFGTAAVMYPLKLIVLLPALYMIDDEMAGDEFGRRFIKLVILVLGAGPAIRNSILLLLG